VKEVEQFKSAWLGYQLILKPTFCLVNSFYQEFAVKVMVHLQIDLRFKYLN